MENIVDILEGHFYAPKDGNDPIRLVHWATEQSVCFSDGRDLVSFIDFKSEFENWAGRDVTEEIDLDLWRKQ